MFFGIFDSKEKEKNPEPVIYSFSDRVFYLFVIGCILFIALTAPSQKPQSESNIEIAGRAKSEPVPIVSRKVSYRVRSDEDQLALFQKAYNALKHRNDPDSREMKMDILYQIGQLRNDEQEQENEDESLDEDFNEDLSRLADQMAAAKLKEQKAKPIVSKRNSKNERIVQTNAKTKPKKAFQLPNIDFEKFLTGLAGLDKKKVAEYSKSKHQRLHYDDHPKEKPRADYSSKSFGNDDWKQLLSGILAPTDGVADQQQDKLPALTKFLKSILADGESNETKQPVQSKTFKPVKEASQPKKKDVNWNVEELLKQVLVIEEKGEPVQLPSKLKELLSNYLASDEPISVKEKPKPAATHPENEVSIRDKLETLAKSGIDLKKVLGDLLVPNDAVTDEKPSSSEFMKQLTSYLADRNPAPAKKSSETELKQSSRPKKSLTEQLGKLSATDLQAIIQSIVVPTAEAGEEKVETPPVMKVLSNFLADESQTGHQRKGSFEPHSNGKGVAELLKQIAENRYNILELASSILAGSDESKDTYSKFSNQNNYLADLLGKFLASEDKPAKKEVADAQAPTARSESAQRDVPAPKDDHEKHPQSNAEPEIEELNNVEEFQIDEIPTEQIKQLIDRFENEDHHAGSQEPAAEVKNEEDGTRKLAEGFKEFLGNIFAKSDNLQQDEPKDTQPWGFIRSILAEPV